MPNMHPQQLTGLVVNAEHLNITQPHQQHTNTHKDNFHTDPHSHSDTFSADYGGSRPFSRDFHTLFATAHAKSCYTQGRGQQ
ncbi:MAG: hypothetical protein OXB92_16995 [Acidimicrobiaceae bacterium]|nr:hypothetical protein [Acidimicrobiia bacterium]MCY4495544.1 hypothetical protein [Acidimicrobiaceae bacterium]